MKNKIVLTLSSMAVISLMMTGSLYAASGRGNAGDNKIKVGRVENVHLNKVVVEDAVTSATSEADLATTTKVFGKDKRLLRLKDIKPNDKIAIISTESATASGGALFKRILRVYVKSASASGSAESKRHAVEGVITNISGNVITLAHQVHTDRITPITVNDQTAIVLKGVSSPTVANLQIGLRVVVIGDLVNGVLTAKRIHVIPGKAPGLHLPTGSENASGSGEASESATPPVDVTPTSSATPSSTPTTTPASTSATPTVTP